MRNDNRECFFEGVGINGQLPGVLLLFHFLDSRHAVLIFGLDFNLGESVVVKREFIDRTDKRRIEIDVHIADNQGFFARDGSGLVFARSEEFAVDIEAELCILHVAHGHYMVPVAIEIGGCRAFGQRFRHVVIDAEIEASVLIFEAEP